MRWHIGVRWSAWGPRGQLKVGERWSESLASLVGAAITALALPLTVVRLLPQVSLPLTLAVACGVLVSALLPVLTALATGALVGAVPAAVAAGPHSPAARAAVVALAVVGALFVATRLLVSLRTTLAAALGRRLDVHLRERVMQALNRPAGIAHLEDHETRDRIERALATSGARWRAGDTVAPLSSAASAWLQSAGATLVLARFSVPLALGWFGMWVVASHFIRREFLRGTEVANNQTSYMRRADYLRQLVMAPPAAKEVRVWGLVDWLTERLTEEQRRVLEPIWRERAQGHRVQVVTALGPGAAYVAVLVAIGLAAVRGEISLAELATYVAATQAVGAIILPGPDTLALAHGSGTVQPVLELERLSAAVEQREALRGTVAPTGMPGHCVRLEGVTFGYPRPADPAADAGPPVLQELDLCIPAGRSLAIVGENGAGKTTLVKLLARLYDPGAGRITVDGVDLRDIDPRAWQRRVAAVFQDFLRFALTARDNVALGAPERMHDQAALVEAARLAGALEVVERLPRGWDTVLSRQYRGGADLSGGQWQRLALARALFAARAGASILILDEPTAHLDVRAEAALYARFLELTRGLTTVLISHRFATVRRADRIVVLEGGRVVEDGTHTELLAAGGRYARMFMLQARRFAAPGRIEGAGGAGGAPAGG
ncbi:MAG TPA: ABC transporter ATP-binding protein [Chloroflexota bacterium]|nr:ABC transporter ATP-binding protein [Chloroflexota bacterium]